MENLIIKSFIEKYENETFLNIKSMIKNELDENNLSIIFDDQYTQYIFEFAAYEYCGLEPNKIALMIEKMGNSYTPKIPLEKIKDIHKKSIIEIQKHFETTQDDILKINK